MQQDDAFDLEGGTENHYNYVLFSNPAPGSEVDGHDKAVERLGQAVGHELDWTEVPRADFDAAVRALRATEWTTEADRAAMGDVVNFWRRLRDRIHPQTSAARTVTDRLQAALAERDTGPTLQGTEPLQGIAGVGAEVVDRTRRGPVLRGWLICQEHDGLVLVGFSHSGAEIEEPITGEPVAPDAAALATVTYLCR